eukprot:SAG11_NODE_15536_length_574_cov_2.829474_1_plen_73_part_00
MESAYHRSTRKHLKMSEGEYADLASNANGDEISRRLKEAGRDEKIPKELEYPKVKNIFDGKKGGSSFLVHPD